jgi:aminoglycoside phosphotransferase family enzyme/predicted kinase/CBS domain-containing protein
MRIEQLMTESPKSCEPGHTLSEAAQMMRDYHCGCLPVTENDRSRRVVGMVTDRDICMAAELYAKPLREIRVGEAMARDVRACNPGDPLGEAEAIMGEARVRRLPVVDEADHLLGLLSLTDLVREAVRQHWRKRPQITEAEVGAVLAMICEPYDQPVSVRQAMHDPSSAAWSSGGPMQTHTVAGSQRGGQARAESEHLARDPSSVSVRGGTTPESINPLVLRSLGQPSAYPNDASAALGIEHIQTHISDLFLTRDRVYKLRKAVDLAFLDFTTRSERNADCVREVQLNRRLAPDVYLGVAPLELGPDGFVVGKLADAPPVALTDAAEHCVVMRRLPVGRDALSLLSAGRLTSRHIDAVAERIARFHQENRLPPQRLKSDRAILQRVIQPFQDCIRALQAAPHSPDISATLRVIEGLARSLLDARGEQVCAYARRGSRVDGHGDLHLEHVWFEHDADSPVMIDCLEFSRALRRTDVACEIGFLAMDLAYRGREDLAERLLGRYANAADAFDLYWAVDYCQSYRAVVRAKVSAIASADSALGQKQREAAEQSVDRHLAFAESILRKRSCGSLVLLCGKVGTGKSTVAEYFGDECGGILISSDHLRKRLAGLPPEARVAVPTDTGLYSPQRRAAIYEAMLERAAPVVASGRLAVLDASFDTADQRDRARRWASERGAPVLLIEVECDEGTTLDRLTKRQAAGGSASDAGPEFYATSAARFEPPDEWPRGTRVQLRTDAPSWRVDLRWKLRSWRSRNLKASEK